MSKASATSWIRTPDISLSFTAFTLNSAVYLEIFLGPFARPIPTSSVRPECQLYRVNCRVRCSEVLGDGEDNTRRPRTEAKGRRRLESLTDCNRGAPDGERL